MYKLWEKKLNLVDLKYRQQKHKSIRRWKSVAVSMKVEI